MARLLQPLLAVSVVCAACASSSGGGTPAAPVDAGADTGADSSVSPPSPLDVRFDAYNVGLAGAFIPNESARRPALLAALAAYETDVLCISEAWAKSDKEAIEAAVKAKLPFAAFTHTNLSTPVADRHDANGTLQPAPTTPPCAGEHAASLTAGLDCLTTHCSTSPGSMDGKVTSTACAKQNCAAAAASLLFAADKRCYGCFAAILPSSTIRDLKTECTTEPNGGLFAKGQNGLMILSRYPLSEVEQLVMPGTWIQRTVLKATATLPNGAAVDAYCNHLTPFFSDTTFTPYTGQFGAGDANGWLGEQLLQTKQLLAFVIKPAK